MTAPVASVIVPVTSAEFVAWPKAIVALSAHTNPIACILNFMNCLQLKGLLLFKFNLLIRLNLTAPYQWPHLCDFEKTISERPDCQTIRETRAS
jgi:hypothetical protein